MICNGAVIGTIIWKLSSYDVHEYGDYEIIKSSSQSQSESSSVVVVEKDSPAAGVAVQAAQEYLDKNQGAKVEKRISWIYFYVFENVSGQKQEVNVGFFWKIKVYLVFSGRVLLTFSNFPILIQSSSSEKVGKQSLVEVDPMAEGVTAANTVSCWYFFFKKYIWLIHFLHHNRRSALPLTRW